MCSDSFRTQRELNLNLIKCKQTNIQVFQDQTLYSSILQTFSQSSSPPLLPWGSHWEERGIYPFQSKLLYFYYIYKYENNIWPSFGVDLYKCCSIIWIIIKLCLITLSRLCSKLPNTTYYSWFSQYDHVASCANCHHLALPIRFLFHPAFCPGKLTCGGHTPWIPYSQLPAGDQRWKAWLEKTSQEESKAEALTPLAPSLRDCLSLAASLDRRSLLLSSTLLLHNSILPHPETSAFPSVTPADLRVLSLPAPGSLYFPTPLHIFIISLLIYYPSWIVLTWMCLS